MNPTSEQLAGLQLELVMVLSASIDLQSVLDGTLKTLLRRIDAHQGAVYSVMPSEEAIRAVLECVLPRASTTGADDAILRMSASVHVEAPSPPRREVADNGDIRHLFILPRFGLLEFRRRVELPEPVLRCLSVVMDRLAVSARACQAHAELRASQQRYAALAATLPEVIFDGSIEASGRLTFSYVSPRAQSILGVSAHALTRDASLLEHRVLAEDRETLRQRLAAAHRAGASFEVLVRLYVASDTSPRWILIGANPRPDVDGTRCVWSGFIQDVSARERLAAAERESQRLRFSALLTSVSDAIIGTDASGQVTHWNRGAERMFGHEATQVLGQPVSIIVPARLRDAHRSGMERVAATGESSLAGRPIELQALHADGHEFPVEFVLSRVEEDGEVAFVGVLRDLSERRLREFERERTAEESHRLAAALLRLSQLPWEESLEYKTRVAAVLAQALKVERVLIWRVSDGELHLRTSYGQRDAAARQTRALTNAEMRLYREALEGDGDLIFGTSSDHADAPWYAKLVDVDALSFAHLPLRSLDGLIGVLGIESHEAREWRPAEVAFCREACNLIVQGIERGTRRQIEVRQAAVLAAVSDGVIACDAEGRVLLLNPVAEALTTWPEALARGRPLTEVYRTTRPEDGQVTVVPGDQILRSGTPWRREGYVDLHPRTAATLPVSDSAAPIHDGERIVGMVLTFRDVSDELAARREIELQNHQLIAIGEAIPDLLFTVNHEGRLKYAQQGHRADLIVAPEEVANHTLASLFDAPLALRLLTAVRRALSERSIQTVEYELAMDQGLQTFEARMARMTDGEVMVLVRNVTEDRRRQQALQLERQRLEAVLASTSAIIYSARLPDFEIDYMSQSVEAVLGFTADSMMAQVSSAGHIHPDDLPVLRESRQRLLKHGHAVGEYRHRNRDGGYRWMRDEMRGISDAAGEVTRVVGAAVDISDRRLGEERLHKVLAIQQVVADVSGGFLASRGSLPTLLLQRALGQVGVELGGARCYLVQLVDGRPELALEWCADGVTPRWSGDMANSAEGITLLMATLVERRACYVPSVSGMNAESHGIRQQLHGFGIERLAVVPLEPARRPGGFIGIEEPEVASLGPEDLVALLELLATTVASGLQRCRDEAELHELNAKLTQRSEQQRLLLQLSADMARAHSQQEVLDAVMQRLRGMFGVQRICVLELLRHQGCFRPLSTQHYGISFIQGGPTGAPITGTAIEEAVRSGLVVSTRDHPLSAFADWSASNAQVGLDQFVVVPLLGPEGAFGALEIGMQRLASPSLTEIDWSGQIASMLAAHLVLHQGRQALERLNEGLETRVAERTRELLDSEERFSGLFRDAPQAMLIVDREHRVVQSNSESQKVFCQDSLDGLALSQLIDTHALAAREESTRGFQVAATRPDGSHFTAEIAFVPLTGREEVIVGLTDISERLAYEDALARSLSEKETLLKEIHHRVKNNLQIISSLLMLQSSQAESGQVRALFEESVHRVRSMAMIHEQLYGVDSLARIDFGEYARNLLQSLGTALAPQARIEADTDAAELTVDLAVPLGLILNELLTNALKYGLPARPRADRGSAACDVRVEVRAAPHEVVMKVTDYGPGLPSDIDIDRSPTLGLQLIRTLTRQLRASLSHDCSDGTCFVVSCPREGAG